MSELPLISVVICTYNQADTVAEAIDSALAQDHRPIEVLVVDNGSTDGTADVLAAYEGHPEVRLLHHDRNEAITKRLNHAVAESRGAYLSLLYADDLYLPHKLSYQLAAFADLGDDHGVVYTPGLRHNVVTDERWQSESLDASGHVLLDLLRSSQRGRYINPISPLIRRQCFLRHPLYEDVFVEGEGHYLRLAVTHQFAYLPEPTVIMREHASNMGKAIKRNGENAALLLDRLVERYPLAPAEVRAVQRAKAELHRNLGWQGIRVLQDGPWARRCYRRAIALRPAELVRPKTLGGLALSFLPTRALRFVNGLGFRVRRSREFVTFKEGYE